jgi:hypothetical protein
LRPLKRKASEDRIRNPPTPQQKKRKKQKKDGFFSGLFRSVANALAVDESDSDDEEC